LKCFKIFIYCSDQTRQQFILDGLSLAIEVFLEQQNAADKDVRLHCESFNSLFIKRFK